MCPRFHARTRPESKSKTMFTSDSTSWRQLQHTEKLPHRAPLHSFLISHKLVAASKFYPVTVILLDIALSYSPTLTPFTWQPQFTPCHVHYAPHTVWCCPGKWKMIRMEVGRRQEAPPIPVGEHVARGEQLWRRAFYGWKALRRHSGTQSVVVADGGQNKKETNFIQLFSVSYRCRMKPKSCPATKW